MRKLSLTCLLLLVLGMFAASPALALDTLGVADTTGMSAGIASITGRHTVGWTSTYIYHTGASDTVLQWAYMWAHAAGTSPACSTVISVYDSATGTLQAQSDTIIFANLVYPNNDFDSAAISGYLHSNTAYKVGVQNAQDAASSGRPFAKTVTWGDIYRLDSQGLTAPADVNSHAANNQNLFYGYVTIDSTAGEPPAAITNLRRREEARR